jgi:hypothetical protein
MINEYETADQMEMAYIAYLGMFPFEYDRSNERKVVMIIKGDYDVIEGKLREMWDDDERSKDFRKHLNAFKTVKQQTWVGGKFDPNFYRRSVEIGGDSNEKTIKKVHQ